MISCYLSCSFLALILLTFGSGQKGKDLPHILVFNRIIAHLSLCWRPEPGFLKNIFQKFEYKKYIRDYSRIKCWRCWNIFWKSPKQKVRSKTFFENPDSGVVKEDIKTSRQRKKIHVFSRKKKMGKKIRYVQELTLG